MSSIHEKSYKATYTKLNKGWGVRIVANKIDVPIGTVAKDIRVHLRNGNKKTVAACKVIWIGDNKFGDGQVALCLLNW